MSEIDFIAPEFVRKVRNALTHLYDYAYLQNHPLAALLDPGRDLDRVTRGQELRRLLLDCIEALRPQEDDEARPEAASAHSLLTFRFVDGMPLKEIAALRAMGQRQAYRELQRSVEAVARLLHDRLRVARPDTDFIPSAHGNAVADPVRTAQAEVVRLQSSAHVQALDLHEVLQDAVDMMSPVFASAGLRIVIASPGAWPMVLADRVMLRQALLNLLTHALDSVARGDLTMIVSTGRAQVSLEICASAGTRRPSSQPGAEAPVSLYVSHALLAAQGGWLETVLRQGRWQARIVLPAPAEAAILVVDDNHRLVALLQRYLASHDLKVVGATDGRQALRLAQELAPRLITLDVMMPGEDGWEILRKLKASPTTAHIPVIICSVLRAHELARTMGASDYVTKPVTHVELVQVLRRWLGPLLLAE